MSRIIPISVLTPKDARRLIADLTVTVRDGNLRCYRERGDELYIPLGYDVGWLGEGSVPPSKTVKPRYTYTPKKKLYSGEEQRKNGVEEGRVKDQVEMYLEVRDSTTHLLHASTGIGKTLIMTHIAAYHGGRTWVICPNTEVLKQWEAAFLECDVTVGYIVNPRNVDVLPDVAVLLSTVETGRKVTPQQTCDIDVVIYDECHLSTTTCVTETLLNVAPSHLYLCSATPNREDMVHRALTLYHGNRITERLIRKEFEAIRCDTGLVPEIRYMQLNGAKRIDYSFAMNSIQKYPDFIPLLVSLVTHVCQSARGRTIMLFKENAILYAVGERLTIPYFVANKKVSIRKELQDERLILAIDKKAKEGVDIQGITDVILAYSTKRIEQPEGRAREDNFRLWIVCHEHNMFNNHWRIAKEWCDKRSMGTCVYETLYLPELRASEFEATSSS